MILIKMSKNTTSCQPMLKLAADYGLHELFSAISVFNGHLCNNE